MGDNSTLLRAVQVAAGTSNIFCASHLHHALRGHKWHVVMWLLEEQDLDLSRSDWLDVKHLCIRYGKVDLLARASYTQRRDALVAHQAHWNPFKHVNHGRIA